LCIGAMVGGVEEKRSEWRREEVAGTPRYMYSDEHEWVEVSE